MAFEYRRKPALRRKISEIRDDDVRARILGIILEKEKDRIVIDDGTGKADISIDTDIMEEVKEDIHTTVEVICRIAPLEEGRELRAEAITDMSSLDMDAYRKVFGQ